MFLFAVCLRLKVRVLFKITHLKHSLHKKNKNIELHKLKKMLNSSILVFKSEESLSSNTLCIIITDTVNLLLVITSVSMESCFYTLEICVFTLKPE